MSDQSYTFLDRRGQPYTVEKALTTLQWINLFGGVDYNVKKSTSPMQQVGWVYACIDRKPVTLLKDRFFPTESNKVPVKIEYGTAVFNLVLNIKLSVVLVDRETWFYR